MGFQPDVIGVYTIVEHHSLLDKPDVAAMIRIIEAVKAGELMIDTLSASLVTEETNEAFQKVAQAANRITEKTGARVTLIHHTGKDTSRGARGGSPVPRPPP